MKTFTQPKPVAWNIIYTKPQCEKKVAGILSDKNIETFVPVKKVAAPWWSLKKVTETPLFSSLVFVKAAPEQLAQVKKVPGVVNVMYWLGAPAQVKDEEITMLKGFLFTHSNVSVQKTEVLSFVQSSSDQLVHKLKVPVNYTQFDKIEIPTLGFRLIAEDAATETNVFQMNKQEGKLVAAQMDMQHYSKAV